MTRPDLVQGCHSRQCRYTLSPDLEARVQADATPIATPVAVIVQARTPHREVAKALRMLAKEIETQP
jgi:hypothetical protein